MSHDKYSRFPCLQGGVFLDLAPTTEIWLLSQFRYKGRSDQYVPRLWRLLAGLTSLADQREIIEGRNLLAISWERERAEDISENLEQNQS